jgi:pyruvate dehydrogenase kinase 2/3/4
MASVGYQWSDGEFYFLGPSILMFPYIELHYPRRYYANPGNVTFPPEVHEYNKAFTRALELIKRRHDPTVTTVAQGVLEWKRSQRADTIGTDIQAWLDRFYMSRIGIRFLIGQRVFLSSFLCFSEPD